MEGRTGSGIHRPLLVLAILLIGLLPAPAQADPVLCLTVTYEKFNGPKHTVVDDCWIPSPWEPIFTATDDCYGPPQIVRVCETSSVSAPI